ncbi:MAG: glycoside hydrolase family 43 protein [Acidimicrobiales bacterium]
MATLAIAAVLAGTLDRTTEEVVVSSLATENVDQPVGASPQASATAAAPPLNSRVRCDGKLDPTEWAHCRVGTWVELVRLDGHADPDVLLVDGAVHLYATNTLAVGNVVHTTIDDRGTFTSDAMPTLPGWTMPGWLWAPEVVAQDDSYAMYFTSREIGSGAQCLGVAFASDPSGPFIDDRDEPLLCQRDLGGSIDASVHQSNGQRYLVWKNDGNSLGLRSSIWLQPLSGDGRSLLGNPVRILDATFEWEGGIVEAPEMLKFNNEWLLLYSANRFDSAAYTTGLARCNGPTGPCRSTGEPWSDDDDPLLGLGGMSSAVLADSQSRLVAYHGWPDDAIGGRDTRVAVVALVPSTGDKSPWADLRSVDAKSVETGPISTRETADFY